MMLQLWRESVPSLGYDPAVPGPQRRPRTVRQLPDARRPFPVLPLWVTFPPGQKFPSPGAGLVCIQKFDVLRQGYEICGTTLGAPAARASASWVEASTGLHVPRLAQWCAPHSR